MTLKDFIANQNRALELLLKAQRAEAKSFFAAQKEAGINFIHTPFVKTKTERRKEFKDFMDAQDVEYKDFCVAQKQALQEFYNTQAIELELFLKNTRQV